MSSFSRLSRQELEGLIKLNHPELLVLRKLFDNQLAETLKSLITAEGVHLHRLQGRAGYLADLLESVEQAASALDRGR